IGLDQPVIVAFNQPMDHASTQAAFTLVNTNSRQQTQGSFSWSDDSATITFKPNGGLALDGQYQASVQTSALGATGGVALSAPALWAFSAVATPAVAKTDPSG